MAHCRSSRDADVHVVVRRAVGGSGAAAKPQRDIREVREIPHNKCITSTSAVRIRKLGIEIARTGLRALTSKLRQKFPADVSLDSSGERTIQSREGETDRQTDKSIRHKPSVPLSLSEYVQAIPKRVP